MTSSLALWIGAAVLLFWSVGAYNRLVRLRAEVRAGFAALDAALRQQIELVDALLPPGQATEPAPLEPGGPPSWRGGLRGASAQVAAALAAARARPLDGPGIAALAAAWEVLDMAWQRTEREDAHDLAGPQLPEQASARHAQLQTQARAAAQAFNDAVRRHNQAVVQFPAVLLAWLFGFRPGRPV